MQQPSQSCCRQFSISCCRGEERAGALPFVNECYSSSISPRCFCNGGVIEDSPLPTIKARVSYGVASHVTETVLTPVARWHLVHLTVAGNLNAGVRVLLDWKTCSLAVFSPLRLMYVSPRLTTLLDCHISTLPARSELRAREVAHAVIAVGFACFGMNLVGVDASGKPCTPVFTYAGSSGSSCGPSPSPPPPAGDGSSKDSPAGGCSVEKDVMKRLRTSLERMGRGEKGGLEEARRRTGAPTHVSYAPAQLLRWLQETTTAATVATPTRERANKGDSNQRRWQPPQRSHVKVWQTLPSLVAARWCCLRSSPVSYSEASWTGMLDLRKLEVKTQEGWCEVGTREGLVGACVWLLKLCTHTARNTVLPPPPPPPPGTRAVFSGTLPLSPSSARRDSTVRRCRGWRTSATCERAQVDQP